MKAIKNMDLELYRDYLDSSDFNVRHEGLQIGDYTYERLLSCVLDKMAKIGTQTDDTEDVYFFCYGALVLLQERCHKSFSEIDWDDVLNRVFNLDALYLSATRPTIRYELDNGYPHDRRCFLALLKRVYPDFDINEIKNKNDIGLLAIACWHDFDGVYLQRILDFGADVSALSKYHGRPIHFINPEASFAIQKIRVLLANGADPMERLTVKDPKAAFIFTPEREVSFYDIVDESLKSKNAHASWMPLFNSMMDLIAPFKHGNEAVADMSRNQDVMAKARKGAGI